MSKQRVSIYTRSDGVTLAAWCRENDVCYHTARYYILHGGFSVDKACALALKNRHNLGLKAELFYNGKTLRQYCLENNLKYPRIYYRIRFLGWDVERAIKQDSLKKRSKPKC